MLRQDDPTEQQPHTLEEFENAFLLQSININISIRDISSETFAAKRGKIQVVLLNWRSLYQLA